MKFDRHDVLFWEKEAKKFHQCLKGYEPLIHMGLEFFKSIHILVNWAVPALPSLVRGPVFLGFLKYSLYHKYARGKSWCQRPAESCIDNWEYKCLPLGAYCLVGDTEMITIKCHN